MSDASTTFFTDEMAAHDAYKLCTGLIVPRPIGWIGSLSADGIAQSSRCSKDFASSLLCVSMIFHFFNGTL